MHATSTSGQVQAGPIIAAPSSTSKLVSRDGAFDCFSPAHVGACMQFSFRSGFLSTREVNSTRWDAGQVAAGVAQLHGLSSNHGHRTRESMDLGARFLGAAAVPAYSLCGHQQRPGVMALVPWPGAARGDAGGG